MSDFSITAYCHKHRVRFAPDDGDCPGCADERCPLCGRIMERDVDYPYQGLVCEYCSPEDEDAGT